MTLFFASANANKVRELQQIFPPSYELKSLLDLTEVPDIPETATTFAGNALLKVEYLSEHYGVLGFADDSGLEVAALNGAPGVYSARYAGEHGNATANIEKLLCELQNESNRAARFVTVIALKLPEGVHYFEGEIRGTITTELRGQEGFGYDPIFIPEGSTRTFAEMSKDEKNAISHRGRAVRKLLDFLEQRALNESKEI
ncbi:RdgB/HAM1 family non-canonical purine NTP pyrophosphatase [Flavobacterium sp.]|uniref:RdgB/HAM1 family non-canonical purine NTP pyrophosphatase n=1 Tax=Flavobacterium sp. TaxID=239 RepID=UPI00260BD793|nr:RdgB/HAM1 family non-canonical purine NTP pyrophosphatase [Flavobacterium sp.]